MHVVNCERPRCVPPPQRLHTQALVNPRLLVALHDASLMIAQRNLQLTQLQQTIKQDVEKRIDKQQRQYFLMEQLKSIKKELGLEKDDKVRTAAAEWCWVRA